MFDLVSSLSCPVYLGLISVYLVSLASVLVSLSVYLCLDSSSVFVYLFLSVKSAFLFPCSVISCFTLAGYVHVSVLVSFLSHFHWTQSVSPVMSLCLLSVPCFCGCLVNLFSCLFVYSFPVANLYMWSLGLCLCLFLVLI